MHNLKPIVLTSPHNDQVKRWRKLQSRKGRQTLGTLWIEGEHLLEESVKAGWRVRALIVDQEREAEHRQWWEQRIKNVPVYFLPTRLYRTLADTETPQGIAAEVEIPKREVDPAIPADGVLLLLDAVQDPGNVGTMLRTARAVGATGVWLGKGTVDPYNPKVVRAAMGALFHVPIRMIDLHEELPRLRSAGYRVVGTHPRGDNVHFDVSYPGRTAFLLGNEGRGVDPELMRWVDCKVSIPMPGGAESLNVSVTASLLLYEYLRQQRGGSLDC
ncbi:23S rRNA methyltransferase [Polycladomyces abyssicola]|uniref:23S rRNA methyltransferase n=1 Tax=Polycladomyces abyssicola TaxID=1125966 RepID=A0A8D5ZMQ6_9BACL|nr:23S rRNA methyltransferase [Polycladomyces abyssicola]